MFEHTTYDMKLALVAFRGDFEVYVAHPEDDDVRLWSVEEIQEAEDHMFVIRMREKG